MNKGKEMTPEAEAVRIIDARSHSWISGELEDFCGRYELDGSTGLYFKSSTRAEIVRLISATFIQLPLPLRAAAIYLGLTVSTTEWLTTHSGDCSAVYGAWGETDHARILPHLEMAAISLTLERVVHHLAHELSHLFWAIQLNEARALYASDMVRLTWSFYGEVTPYAESFLRRWRMLALEPRPNPVRLERALDKWLMESFCESVALLCDKSCEAGRLPQVTALLEERRKAIATRFGLVV